MRLNSKSISRWVIILSLMLVIGILPKFTKIIWAHGPELSSDDSSKGKTKEEKGPHGGQVIVFEDNHLEFTANHDSGEIVLFLLDKDLKAVPVPESYSGVVYLNMADGSKKTITLRRVREGPVARAAACIAFRRGSRRPGGVSLKIGEKRENFRFNWAPAAHAHGEKK